jgi:serralysin
VLSASAFFIGTAAHDANDRIIYDNTTGKLIYDSNGNAAGGAIQFASAGGVSFTNTDFVVT